MGQGSSTEAPPPQPAARRGARLPAASAGVSHHPPAALAPSPFESVATVHAASATTQRGAAASEKVAVVETAAPSHSAAPDVAATPANDVQSAPATATAEDAAPAAHELPSEEAPPRAVTPSRQQDPAPPAHVASPTPNPAASATPATPAAQSAPVPPAPATMRAWVVHSKCDSVADSAVRMEASWPVPTPGDGEVRIKVVCAALNPVDFKRVSGLGLPDIAFPAVLGVDCAGVVESSRDPAFTPGDRVCAFTNLKRADGTFAEYVVCPGATVIRIDPRVSFADAAAMPCAGWTAYVMMFHKLRLAAGASVLVLGGAGGVGNYAIALAKLAGCRVIATCSSASAPFVTRVGADATVDYADTSLPEQAKAIVKAANGPVDYVVDAVGALTDRATLHMACSVLRIGGELATVANVSTEGESQLFLKQLSLHYVLLFMMYGDARNQALLKSVGESMMTLAATGANGHKLPSLVTEFVQFSQVQQALATMMQRKTKGKIVMSFAPPAAARRVQAQ